VELVETTAGFTGAMARARRPGRRIGLVPTMGALHAGHRSLIDRAAAECDHVAVTIFVNPLQFGSCDDLERYPRTLDADLSVCEAAGVGTVFAPSVAEMYPGWPGRVATTVSVQGVSEGWEGASRPGHFDGVATVVAKLFSMAGECTAYFGEKDFQQLAVVRRMVADLSIPVEVVGCPTVREPDGLALSSRNVRLRDDERRAATVLHRGLLAGRDAVSAGEDRPERVVRRMADVVAGEPLVHLDYAAAVNAEDLSVPASLADVAAVRLLVAADVGPVRLIDNCACLVPSGAPAGAAAPTRPTMAPARRAPVGSAPELALVTAGPGPRHEPGDVRRPGLGQY
jgi:pantoate--beta-alanine ligase